MCYTFSSMKQMETDRYYTALIKSLEQDDAPRWIEKDLPNLEFYLRHPDVARSHIPRMTNALHMSMRAPDQCVLPSTKRAWDKLSEVITPYKDIIIAWNAVAVVFGSVAYDAPNRKDIDLALYSRVDAMPRKIRTILDNAMWTPKPERPATIDFSLQSLEPWKALAVDPHTFSDPDQAIALAADTSLQTPVLYGILFVGNETVRHQLQQDVLAMVNKHAHIAGLVAADLAYTLKAVRLRQAQKTV